MPTQAQYDAVSKAFRQGKSNLTRAKNRKDWAKVIKVCEETLALFEDQGLYPDDWAIFEAGKRDAQTQLRWAEVDKCSCRGGK